MREVTETMFAGWIAVAAIVALALAAMLGSTPVGMAAEGARAVPASRAEIQLSFAPLVRRAAPAVVNIYATRLVRTPGPGALFDDPFFRRFFGDDFFGPRERERRQNSLGSGVIVRPGGMIVTNHHVIEGANDIKVVLDDRREFEAAVVLTDEKSDLAVLKIDPEGESLPVLDFEDSDKLEVGDLVIAIGNPFGVGKTVTSGIISAVSRGGAALGAMQSFIQTDAAINPGNSGGALVTVGGKLAGINTAIFSRSGGSHGIGFAIPANLVKVVVRAAETHGKLVRPWFGAAGQVVTAELADSLGLDRPGGVLVNELYPGGPAEAAGLRIGDVIRAIDGHEITGIESLMFRIATAPIGDSVAIDLWRRGESVRVMLELVPPPADPPPEATVLEGRHPLAGATAANLSPALGEELDFDMMERGVVVLEVARGSPAARLGLRPGDILERLNGVKIERVGGLVDLLAQERESWALTIRRDGRALNVVVRS